MHRRTFARSILAIGVLASLPTIAFFAQAEPTRKITVRLPIPVIEAAQTPLYVALDNGYYEEEGLNVEFLPGSRELNPVKMIASGADTIGILGGPDTLIVARDNGVPIKAVSILHRASNFPCLITLAESGITSIKQLEGKKVGMFYGHISTDVIRSFIHKNRINVTEVDVGFDYNQLVTGGIDAQWAFRTTAGLDLPAKGVKINVINPESSGIITHGYTIFVSETTLNRDEDLVRQFLRATYRGIDTTLVNPDLAITSLLKRDPSLDRELNKKRLALYNAVTSSSSTYPAGHMDEEMFNSTYERLRAEGVIKNTMRLDTLYQVIAVER
ncbi:MAG: ABC transporter substrate-binding protein [bacterium]|nr:ABC transporter substrate-binding protein [bacterium]